MPSGQSRTHRVLEEYVKLYYFDVRVDRDLLDTQLHCLPLVLFFFFESYLFIYIFSKFQCTTKQDEDAWIKVPTCLEIV